MRHLIALFIVVCFLCPVAWAGEKEEIELKLALVAEKERRLQTEWSLLQKEKAEVQELAKKFSEKAKVPEKK